MAYQPIENYGIIGNMRTVALVGMDGSIDWLCYPHFDSPSVFGALLDDRIGGRFQISALPDHVKHRQFYWPETNILVTRFLTDTGVGEVLDYMPVGSTDGLGSLVRVVSVTRGEMAFRLICQPAFNYARDPHTVEVDGTRATFRTETLDLTLTSNLPLQSSQQAVTSEFTLKEGDEAVCFILSPLEADTSTLQLTSTAAMDALFQSTVTYWRAWLAQCTYTGRWREIVLRSALALKLLTFEPTGAVVAAATTSLPEYIGGSRNWDYRYTWVRDAAFTIYALMRIGFTGEAAAFMGWLDQRSHEPGGETPLQPLYGIDGRHQIIEETLDHLDGYRGSKPVRIGNAAADQFQLDLYGELLDSVYLYNKYGTFISFDLWAEVRRMVDWVCDHWQQNDLSLWEVRSKPVPFVFSRLMCWVALDRGLRLARKRSFPCDHDRWTEVRDTIYEEIMARGWNGQLQSFVQQYGGDALDASSLLMPLVFFVGPDDPRMLLTLKAILQSPDKGGLTSGGMVYRYNIAQSEDGLNEPEGSFNMCTFWLVEALTRAGEIDQARLIFERMLTNANHLGLYAEQTGPSGEMLGNFPQAFTHLALISAAFNLNRALDGKQSTGTGGG